MKEFNLEDPTPLSGFFRGGFEHSGEVASQQVQRFDYSRPALRSGKTRAAARLVNTDILFAVIQLFESGGENIMHSHAGMDGFWFVLSGKARFYIAEEESFEVGPRQGLCIPRATRYWFEKTGEEPLEILQVDAIHPNLVNKVTRYGTSEAQRQAEQANIAMFDAQRDQSSG